MQISNWFRRRGVWFFENEEVSNHPLCINSPKKAGIIDEILVKEGDQIKKGQMLVQLNDVDARLQVERAEAGLKQAVAAVTKSTPKKGETISLPF